MRNIELKEWKITWFFARWWNLQEKKGVSVFILYYESHKMEIQKWFPIFYTQDLTLGLGNALCDKIFNVKSLIWSHWSMLIVVNLASRVFRGFAKIEGMFGVLWSHAWEWEICEPYIKVLFWCHFYRAPR